MGADEGREKWREAAPPQADPEGELPTRLLQRTSAAVGIFLGKRGTVSFECSAVLKGLRCVGQISPRRGELPETTESAAELRREARDQPANQKLSSPPPPEATPSFCGEIFEHGCSRQHAAFALPTKAAGVGFGHRGT